MLSTLLRSSIGRPALASLRGRTISTRSAVSSSSSLSRAYPILLGRGLVLTSDNASIILGGRRITTTATLDEPASATGTKKASTTKKTPTAKKTTKVPLEKKKGAAAKKKAVATKKPKAKAVKKVKAAKSKVVKKKKVVPKIFKKDLKPPFPAPKQAWVAFATSRFAELRVDGQSTLMRDYLPNISQEWRRLDQASKDVYKPSEEEWEEYRSRKKEWLMNLEPRIRHAMGKAMPRGDTMPSSPFSEFIRERFASTQYPEGMVLAPQKLKFLAAAYRTEIDPAEKEKLKQRALDSFERRKAEAARAKSQKADAV